jgi:CHAT domain-containing protein
VVPHGPLHRLPFEALDVGGDRAWLDAGPPVVYGPSGSVLQWCRKRRDAQRGASPRYEVVAVGDADFASLQPLPGSRREVESIRATLGADASVALLGKEATAARLFEMAPKARYLHLATHLIADERQRFGQSRLLLTPDGDEGAVSLHDLLERWRDRIPGCALVVLSACDALRGPLQRDEGPYAMPVGFLYAGAAAVVGSLWRVGDASAADLFSDFYARLREGKPKLQAFTEARRALRRKHADARHWAAFVYIGDPR